MRLRAGGRAPRGMKDPLAAFLRHLSLEKDASPHTLRSYRSDLLEFAQHVGRGDGEMWLRGVDARAVRAYLAHLHRRGLEAVTIARQLSALLRWFPFLGPRCVLQRNLARGGRRPRLPSTL